MLAPLFAIQSLGLLAAAVEHRLTSRFVDGFVAWWQAPAAVAGGLAVVWFAIWMSRRDAADLSRPVRWLLTTLRLLTVAAVVTACLDLERIAEHEVVMPSRVAVLIDSSASMSLPAGDADGPATRGDRGAEILEQGGLLAALQARHEVSLWRFDADAEPLAVLPRRAAGSGSGEGDEPAAATPLGTGWQAAATPRGVETRLGEALAAVLEREPSSMLAGVVLLSDGGNNSGLDPLAAADRLAGAEVAVAAVGIGSDALPANVRVADVIAPARVFPGDTFAVTAYLQAQGREGERVTVELRDVATEGITAGEPIGGRLIDAREAVLAADGDLASLRFEVPGLLAPGSRILTVRAIPATADRNTTDDLQAAAIEVVDRVTRVLLMAGGPGREYQFLRNVLHRDASFEVDVLLGTAAAGMSQDADRILDAFPPSDEALAAYDAVVAIDSDWRAIEPAGWARLERWVASESGGLVLIAGSIHMDDWLSDPRAAVLRGLFPVEFRRPGQVPLGGIVGREEPMPLDFTTDGGDAEFLWLAAGRDRSRSVWAEFPGVYSCFPADRAKAGGTIYARVSPIGRAGEDRRIYLAGQLYGAGSVFYVGSGELWRLRQIDDSCYDRLVAQVVRHVSQGRLMRGTRRVRLLVDRDRHPVGGTVQIRLVMADGSGRAGGRPPSCRAVGPDETVVSVPLEEEPDRPGTLRGSFVAGREGSWRIEVDPSAGLAEQPLTHRIQVQLPDRELARPKLDRSLLEQLAGRTGGVARFPGPADWSPAKAAALADEVAALLPDRSRREYETGPPDTDFKRRLNTALLAAGCSCLCLEWIVRRLAKLA
jgi:hypothetical protein